VIARDERIRRRTDALVRRAKFDAARHAGTGLAVGLGLVGLLWWWRRHRREEAPAPGAAPQAAAAAGGEPSLWEMIARELGLSLTSALPMVWPYMPRIVRRYLNPATAAAMLSVVAPLVTRLFRRGPRPAR